MAYPMFSEELQAAFDDLEWELDGQERIDACAARAAGMAPGELGRAEFLSLQGDFMVIAGQLEEAKAPYLAALEDGGPTSIHPKVSLLDVAIQRGETDEADALLKDLLRLFRDGKLSEDDCNMVGETLEEKERFNEAQRWFTMPLRPAEDDRFDHRQLTLLNGRYRVRRALGLPKDGFDEQCDRVRERTLARLGATEYL